MSYQPPLADLAFALDVQAQFGLVRALAPEADEAMQAAVLDAAGQIAAEVLAPLNHSGDREGSRLAGGAVVTPAGFQTAWRAFADGGWSGLSGDPELGGQGLPKALEAAVYEMLHAANFAFALCPTLSAGAAETIAHHGSADQKARWLPRLYSGEWTAAMALTEPQAGSDLAAVAARATPDGGGYRITGQKIFITWGDHDLTENILHLVLARLPDAPEGVKGISLFAAPKRLEDGSLNAIRVMGVEHKLGIHASPTCALAYEGALGELVGEPHQGLARMFTMMNAARLHVGLQGVGVAERALQRASSYARERRQGRSVWSEQAPAAIIDHPDVRRMLMLGAAKTSAARAICLYTATQEDLARLSPELDQRAAALARQALLTPIAKAWATEVGVEVASIGVQVHGGMGYVEETGAAQHYRDSRIAPIYEGTNGIQAIDLIGRKLASDGGAALNTLFDDMLAEPVGEDLAELGARLAKAVDAAQESAAWLIANAGTADALAGASDFLLLMGETLGGWMHLRAARSALTRLEAGDRDAALLKDKLNQSYFYGDRVLALTPRRAAAVMQGCGHLAPP